MLAALLIVFREVLEAGLIVGVVLAASRGVPGRGRVISLGVLSGVLGSAMVAVFGAEISSAFQGRGQELFTATVLLLAVAMLTWHVAWMAEHAREVTARLRKLGDAVVHGAKSIAVLGVAVAVAVAREGSEVVLFLAGIAMQGGADMLSLLAGAAGGLALGATISAAVYFGLAAIPLRRVFAVTGLLVTLLAAGLAAEAVRQLSNAGLLNVLDETLWDTSWLLSEDSWVGRVLHVLIGYMDRPTVMQAVVYIATAAGILLLANGRHGSMHSAQAAAKKQS
jgi:high-affinity iron transporter